MRGGGAAWQPASVVRMELKEVGDQVFAAECILKSRVRKVGIVTCRVLLLLLLSLSIY